MTGSSLESVPAGPRLFLDSPIFVYVFAGSSSECRRLLDRRENHVVAGVTSVVVMADVCYRLMAMDAVARGLMPRAAVGRRLRHRPDVVKQLTACQEFLERIPLIGIDVLPVDLGLSMRVGEGRAGTGLLTNDSLLVAAMRDAGITAPATAGRDFERASGIEIYHPTDLGEAAPALA